MATEMVTEALAGFLAQSRWEDLPREVQHEAKRALLNFMGCALGGCRDEAMEKLSAALGPFFGPEQGSVIGRGERPDTLNAAFLNAVSANVLEFDDTHLRTVIHPGAPVAAAVLAMAERQTVSGMALLHAVALGIETSLRIGNAISPGHYRRGYHITATCGVFGAAVATATLLALDRQRMGWTIAAAAAQSAGLVESLGSMVKSVSVGNAARNGLAGALYAQQGITGPEQPLEGRYAFGAAVGAEPDFAEVTGDLGTRWEALQNAYKPYPCGVVLFPVIDGCLELRERHGLRAEQIARIRVKGHPLLLERTDRPEVTHGREAKVSLHHAVAVAFLEGAGGVREFADEAVRRPAVLELRRRVSGEADPAIPVETVFVTVELTDGTRLTEHVTRSRGTMDRPMTDGEIEAKFRDLAAYGAQAVDAQRLIGEIWSLDRCASAGDLMALAAIRG